MARRYAVAAINQTDKTAGILDYADTLDAANEIARRARETQTRWTEVTVCDGGDELTAFQVKHGVKLPLNYSTQK